MKDQLEHTHQVERVLSEGRLKEDADLHNAHVKAQFDKANHGVVINLSDLMAAKEILDLKATHNSKR